jgi:hypothetical protein
MELEADASRKAEGHERTRASEPEKRLSGAAAGDAPEDSGSAYPEAALGGTYYYPSSLEPRKASEQA